MNQMQALHLIRESTALRMQEILDLGISRYMLYALRDSGALEHIGRGIYRVSDESTLEYPDLVSVAIRHPKAVICLISALSFHELTTQIPHVVSIAIPRGGYAPQMDFPPVEVRRFSPDSYREGIEIHTFDSIDVQIYNPEKTIVDCFRFRNQIGMDVVLEALKRYRASGTFNHQQILHYAQVCRVQNIITPYLLALL